MAWKFNVLVVANVTAASDELLAALKRRSERGACGFTLLVPATGGGREGRETAEKRLEAALERMRAASLEVEGMVGDADPARAVAQALRDFPADEIVVSTLPRALSNWLDVDLPTELRRRFSRPVTVVTAA